MPQQDIAITDSLNAGRQAINAQTQELYADRVPGQKVYATDPAYGVVPGVGIDNRTALQAALSAASGGTLVLPNGIIEFQGSALVPPSAKTRIVGQIPHKWTDTWAGDIGARTPAYTGTILQRMSGSAGAFFSAQNGLIHTENIAFRQPGGRGATDGLFPQNTSASHMRITGCRFESLGHIIHNGTVFGANTLRDNFVVDCDYIFYGNIVDCKITDNTFTSNISGFWRTGGGANIITSNRFEWSSRGYTATGGALVDTIANNLFDRIAAAPIHLEGAVQVQLGINHLNRGGTENTSQGSRSHICLKDFTGKLTSVGNTLRHDVDDGGTGVDCPKYLIEYVNTCTGYVEWKGNTDIDGYTTSPIFGSGTTPSVSIEADEWHIPVNIGNANTSTDTLNAMLLEIHNTTPGDSVKVYIYGARKAVDFVTAYKIDLIGRSSATIINAAGYLGTKTMHNIAYGGRTYTLRGGEQYVDLTSGYIDAFQYNGYWDVGKKIYYYIPPTNNIGFLVTGYSAPQTFTPIGVHLCLSATATLDFGSIAAGATAELTITVAGAVTGDAVVLGPPSTLAAGLVGSGRVSATNTVTVRLHNTTTGAIDPASATWRATVVQA